MFAVLAHFLEFISTRRNKQGGRTTLGSISIARNVSFVAQKLDFYPKDFSPAGGNFFLFY